MREYLKTIYLFSRPFVIVVVVLLMGYFIFDPFYVLKDHIDFSKKTTSGNKDFISTTCLLRNYKNQNFDSFILGSSRTIAYKHHDWKNYIGDSAKIFTYDAYSETIFGIYKKVKLLDSLNLKLKNVLIIIEIDETFSKETNSLGYLFIKHPVVSGESKLRFHKEFLKSYFKPKFLFSYYIKKLTGLHFKFMDEFMEKYKINIDPISNETQWLELDSLIKTDSSKYYSNFSHLFFKKDSIVKESNSKITPKQIMMLKEMKYIFDKHQTNYKLVVSPIYSEVKFNNHDLGILKSIFADKIHDFSGKNNITSFKSNYYEFSHYRPHVGKYIMDQIYN